MSKIGKGEWIIVYVIAGTVDVIQWGADLIIGPGEVANEIADSIIGVIFAAYFQIRGVSLIKHPARLASLVGGVLAEMLTVSIAPAWIIDVWYIHHTVVNEEAAIKEARENEELLNNFSIPPLNGNDVRDDTVEKGRRGPRYQNGIGAPTGQRIANAPPGGRVELDSLREPSSATIKKSANSDSALAA